MKNMEIYLHKIIYIAIFLEFPFKMLHIFIFLLIYERKVTYLTLPPQAKVYFEMIRVEIIPWKSKLVSLETKIGTNARSLQHYARFSRNVLYVCFDTN